MSRSGRLSAVLGAVVVLLGGSAGRADAQDVFFTFLIENGWQAAFEHPISKPSVNLTSWGTGAGAASAAFAVVNGQKGPFVGGSAITIWARPVPDPAFAGLGGIAGLIMLDVEGVRAHLAVFETPTGLKGTVAIAGYDTDAGLVAVGTWVLGNGSSVVGGTANDLVVAGVARFRAPQFVDVVDLLLSPGFFSFPQDWPPTFAHGTGPTIAASFGNAAGPFRLFTRNETAGSQVREAYLLLIHFGGDDYVVGACSLFESSPVNPFNCTVSGTGALSYLAGRIIGFGPAALNHYHLVLRLFAALPL